MNANESTASRRGWLLGAAGLGAAAVGASLAFRRQAAGPAVLSAEAQALWGQSFQRPEGGADLVMAQLRGQPLLVNFWATWCPPCVKELPELAAFEREFSARGWRVVGLAVDAPSAVREFLKKLPLDISAQGMAGLTGTGLTRTLGNHQGGLPFSVAFGSAGEIVWRKLGATNLGELRLMAAKLA